MSDEKHKNPAQPSSGEAPMPRSRRTYPREYKLRIVREAEEAARHGAVGALLRREGLYSSLLAAWRREFPLDGEVSLAPVPRGPKPRTTPDQKAIEKLRRENDRLRKKLELSEALVDLQKKRWSCWRVSSRRTAPSDGVRHPRPPVPPHALRLQSACHLTRLSV